MVTECTVLAAASGCVDGEQPSCFHAPPPVCEQHLVPLHIPSLVGTGCCLTLQLMGLTGVLRPGYNPCIFSGKQGEGGVFQGADALLTVSSVPAERAQAAGAASSPR